MRKFHHLPPQASFFPNIIPSSSRKDLRKSQYNYLKENLHPNKNHLSKIGFESVQFGVPKKIQQKDQGLLLDQLLDIKLLQIQQTDLLTKPKVSKNWLAEQIDINQQNKKTKGTQGIYKNNNNNSLLRVKRKSCLKQKEEKGQKLGLKNVNQNNFVVLENSRILNGKTKRVVSVTRDKLYSCRIALKKCVFPMEHKKYQKAKLADFFYKDEKLSPIYKRQGSEDLFISFDTLISMNL